MIIIKKKNKALVKEFLKAGVHLGHSPKEWNPKMAPYILYEKDGNHIIDLIQTNRFLRFAGNALEKKASRGKRFLFVGTNRISSATIAKEAEKVKAFYINYRWLGGTLTNWPTLQKRIKKLNDLEAQEAAKELDKLPKKEANKKRKQLQKLRRSFGGVRTMTKVPSVVIFTNQWKESLAIKECFTLGIPAICIVDTNCDPDCIAYPIPANDDSYSSIVLIISDLARRIAKGNYIYEKRKNPDFVSPYGPENYPEDVIIREKFDPRKILTRTREAIERQKKKIK